jgi:hypothetical protein
MGSSDVFTFGMHRGKAIDDIVIKAPWYIKWAYEALHAAPNVPERGGVTDTQYNQALERLADGTRAKTKKPRADKKVRRFGAFLRLYGPKGTPTHAKLVLAHDAWPDTPEAFYEELQAEVKLDAPRLGARMRVTLREY